MSTTMHRNEFFSCAVITGLALTLAACGGKRRVLVPGPETIHASPDPSQPYVVRMSDGVRDWEVEFPESATGYEVRIPLRTADPAGGRGRIEDLPEPMTEADHELLAELRRSEPSMEREGVFHRGEDLVTGTPGRQDRPAVAPPAARSEEPAPDRPSYLLGVNEVRRLYRSGNPEVAMVRLARLLRAYPDDTRLLAMKGTLWLRLGRPELARRAYEEVLQREPDNASVQQALRRLQSSAGGEAADLDFPPSAN